MKDTNAFLEALVATLPKAQREDKDVRRWLEIINTPSAALGEESALVQRAYEDLCADLVEWLANVREELDAGARFTDLDGANEIREKIRLKQQERFPWRTPASMDENAKTYLEGDPGSFPERPDNG